MSESRYGIIADLTDKKLKLMDEESLIRKEINISKRMIIKTMGELDNVDDKYGALRAQEVADLNQNLKSYESSLENYQEQLKNENASTAKKIAELDHALDAIKIISETTD